MVPTHRLKTTAVQVKHKPRLACLFCLFALYVYVHIQTVYKYVDVSAGAQGGREGVGCLELRSQVVCSALTQALELNWGLLQKQ